MTAPAADERPQAYAALEARFARMAHLGSALSMLSWDRSTLMPKGANAARAETLGTLQVMSHELISAPDVAEDLAAAEAVADRLDPWQQRNLVEMRRSWQSATALPGDLIAALARAGALCEMQWRDAKAQSDPSLYREAQAEVLRLTREKASILGEALGLSPYDALLDEFEPGLRSDRVNALFTDLADFLQDTLPRILDRQPLKPEPLTTRHDDALQLRAAKELMRLIGFDFDHGRLDLSAHPFCGGVPPDVRVTTRFDPIDPLSGLLAVLHECGHAFYEQNLPKDWLAQPVGRSRGMALHESQSLFVEQQIGKDPAFIRTLLTPLMQGAYGNTYTPVRVQAELHHVERSFIRVDADQVTYPLHIILRTRLEQALLSGDLSVADLPGAWDDGFQELFDMRPPDAARGCLQDIHWTDGAIGYFPTYTLGALAAAQLAQAVWADLGSVEAVLESRGSVAPIIAWMSEKVHSQEIGRAHV